MRLVASCVPTLNLSNYELVPNWRNQILKGLYGKLSNFDPLYLHRELQFRANFWYEGIIWDPL